MALNEALQAQLLEYQRNEITEYHIYRRLAETIQAPKNARILSEIADDELRHYNEWKAYTDQDVEPSKFQVWKYVWISRILGFTFGIKLMERGEESAQTHYRELVGRIPQARDIASDENKHEEALIGLLDEERLRYTGSIVLGLNDALVELTGALAGLTLALRDRRLIALTGLITGIAAALSMGASEYLSTQTEETSKNPIKASIYTGTAYILTVLILILPYLVLQNYFLSLACTLAAAIGIIALFTYYIGVARDEPFRRRFLEMAGLSLGVAGLSFVVGFLVRAVLGVDV